MKEITKGNAKQEELTRTGGGFCSSHPHTIHLLTLKSLWLFRTPTWWDSHRYQGTSHCSLWEEHHPKFLGVWRSCPCSLLRPAVLTSHFFLFCSLAFILGLFAVLGCWLSSNRGLLKATSNTGMEISKGKNFLPASPQPSLLRC